MRIWAVVLAAIVLFVASPASPQDSKPSASSTPVLSTKNKFPVTSEIEDASSAAEDARIKRRLDRIFAQIGGTSKVTVEVNSGVVKLSGDVTDGKSENLAEQIASRVDGVVWVENDMSRVGGVEVWKELLEGLKDLFRSIIGLVPSAVAGLVIGSMVVTVGHLIAGRRKFWRRTLPNKFVASLVASGIRFFFWLGGIVTALQVMGASALLSAFLGSAGVIGIAIGFSLRDTVENFLASLILSIRQPFKANDHVVIGDHEGRIVRLTNSATVLMTLDGNQLRIPNSDVFKATVLNYTRNPQRRFSFTLGIDSDDDIDDARNYGLDALKDLEFILHDPPPNARVNEVGDSSVLVDYLAWIDQNDADWHKARTQAIIAVKKALDDNGIGLPEPIYRLRVDPRSRPLPFKGISLKEDSKEESDKDLKKFKDADGASGGKKSDNKKSDDSDDAETADHKKLSRAEKRQVRREVRNELQDVAPDKDIAKMVDKERESSQGDDNDDLLTDDDGSKDSSSKEKQDKDAGG